MKTRALDDAPSTSGLGGIFPASDSTEELGVSHPAPGRALSFDPAEGYGPYSDLVDLFYQHRV